MGRRSNLKGINNDDTMFINKSMVIEKETPYMKKHRALDYKINLKCKNPKQKEYLNLIKDKDITFCTGECGTGKSWIALGAALQLLKEDNNYKKILIIVPTVEAGNMSIGYLKGTKEEKMQPYLDADHYTISKLLDESGNDGKSTLRNLIECGLLEGEGVQFLRGKTLDNTIVVISECENLNKQEMFLILSRIGTSKYIFNGDVKQLDRKDIKRGDVSSGLEYAINKLNNINEIGLCTFDKNDIIRNPIITKIIEAWDV